MRLSRVFALFQISGTAQVNMGKKVHVFLKPLQELNEF